MLLLSLSNLTCRTMGESKSSTCNLQHTFFRGTCPAVVSSHLLSFAKDISPILVQLVAGAGFGIALAKFLYEKVYVRNASSILSCHCRPPTPQYLLGAYTIYLTECPGHLFLSWSIQGAIDRQRRHYIRFCLNRMASIALTVRNFDW